MKAHFGGKKKEGGCESKSSGNNREESSSFEGRKVREKVNTKYRKKQENLKDVCMRGRKAKVT